MSTVVIFLYARCSLIQTTSIPLDEGKAKQRCTALDRFAWGQTLMTERQTPGTNHGVGLRCVNTVHNGRRQHPRTRPFFLHGRGVAMRQIIETPYPKTAPFVTRSPGPACPQCRRAALYAATEVRPRVCDSRHPVNQLRGFLYL